MERAESREQEFGNALDQLRAICRDYEGMTWELKATRFSGCNNILWMLCISQYPKV
jgi:hypothetical protein